ncbi:hypothetical protein [Streptomyces spectabilis]|uniref:Uncharacterized protein n=1 Tax=Streptomyces spectabilis TaxID=68270 RepID=A0A516RIF8_STRST|nr:hypothetical protein [Streptomyces spectabilis]QDQ15448.1 hypothetical protein FH965_36835 [Streptomyces spectabilis]
MQLGEAEKQRRMKDVGYSFNTPIQLRDALPRKADIINEPRVVSDVACKRKTDHLNLVDEDRAQAQREVVADNGRLLAEWTSVRRQKRTAERGLNA